MPTVKYIDVVMSAGIQRGFTEIGQNDANGVQLIIRMKNARGTAYRPSTSAKIAFHAKKSDGHSVILSTDDTDPQISFSGNVVTIIPTAQVVAVAGHIICKLVVTDGTAITGSQIFTLLCAEDLHDDDLTSSSEYKSLETLLYNLALREVEFNLLQRPSPIPVTLAASMTDTTKNYVYVGSEGGYTVGNLYYHNGSSWVNSGWAYQSTGIANGSIALEKVAFQDTMNQVIDNDINIGSYTNGSYASLGAGVFTDNASFKRTGYISIEVIKGYLHIANCHSVVFYTSAYAFISSLSTLGNIQIPATAKYIVINKLISDATVTTLYYCGSDGNKIPTIYERTVSYTNDKKPSWKIPQINTKTEFYKNIPIGTLINDEYANITTGVIITDAGANIRRTDYLEINPIVGYVNIANSNSNAGAFYDTNKVFISGITSTGVKAIPENAKYIIVNIGKTQEGTTITYCDVNGVAIDTILDKAKTYTDSQISNLSLNKWIGKKAVFLGDSITYGAGLTNITTERYSALVKTGLSLASETNYGISGTRLADNITASGSSDTNAMCIRYTNMSNDADLIFVMGGTNDYGSSTGNSLYTAPFGTPTDSTVATFYGALHVLFKGLIEKYPAKTIVVITPLHRLGMIAGGYDHITTNTDTGKTLRDYVNAIREIAEIYGIYVLDLYKELNINPIITSIKTAYMPDGLHPNAAGHQLVANAIISYAKRL